MTIQVTVRLPDDLVAYMDGEVEHSRAHSRATVVAQALDLARRRAAAERDALIYAETEDADMAALVDHVATHPVALDD